MNFLQAKSNSHINHPFFPPGKSRRPKTYWTLFSLDQIVTYVGFGFCEKNQLHNPPGHPGQLIIRPMLSHGKIAQLVRSSDCRQYLMKPFLHLRTHTSWKSMYYQAINVMAITRGPLHWMQKYDIPQMLDHSQHICNEGSKCRKMFETTTHRLEWSITTRIHFGWNVCSCYRCGRSFKTQQSKVIRLGFPLHFAPCVCVCGKSSEALHMLLFLPYEHDVNSKTISLPCWKTVASMKPPGLKATWENWLFAKFETHLSGSLSKWVTIQLNRIQRNPCQGYRI